MSVTYKSFLLYMFHRRPTYAQAHVLNCRPLISHYQEVGRKKGKSFGDPHIIQNFEDFNSRQLMCKASFSASGTPANRRKLGISSTGSSPKSSLFFNPIVTKLYNDVTSKSVDKLCEEALQHVAIVRVKMASTADAVLLQRTVPQGMEEVTATGGLLSLHCGFSFLSLAELLFWVLRSILRGLVKCLFCFK